MDKKELESYYNKCSYHRNVIDMLYLKINEKIDKSEKEIKDILIYGKDGDTPFYYSNKFKRIIEKIIKIDSYGLEIVDIWNKTNEIKICYDENCINEYNKLKNKEEYLFKEMKKINELNNKLSKCYNFTNNYNGRVTNDFINEISELSNKMIKYYE